MDLSFGHLDNNQDLLAGYPTTLPGVLIVDDEVGVLTMMERVISRMELDVKVAQCGEEALQLARESDLQFAMAIIDLNLPGLSGAELVNSLRRACPGISIMMMSGDISIMEDPELESCEVDALMVKPFGLADIRRSVLGLLSLQEVR